MWRYWYNFVKETGIQDKPWTQLRGLQLYDHDANSSDTNITDPEAYNKQKVDQFFTFLERKDVGKSIMKKAKTFLNINLRCEHYTRLVGLNRYGELVQVSVGKSTSVRTSIVATNSRASQRSMEECHDIQAELEQLITTEQIRAMLLYVFEPKTGGFVSNLDIMYRLEFASALNTMFSNARRGEEIYKQRLIQRSTTHLSEIGQFGIQALQLISNQAKHNQMGWLEYTIALPHMDPLTSLIGTILVGSKSRPSSSAFALTSLTIPELIPPQRPLSVVMGMSTSLVSVTPWGIFL